MAFYRQALFMIASIATLQTCWSIHTVDTSSNTLGSRSAAERSFLTATPRSNGSPYSIAKSKLESIFAKQPLANPDKDAPRIALSELQVQRFGHKCDDELTAQLEQPAELQSVPLRFFQIEQSHGDTNASEGDVAGSSDSTGRDGQPPTLQQSLQDNITSVDAGFVTEAQVAQVLPMQGNQGAGYTAAQQAPPALSEVPPLPFLPDDMPATIPVATSADEEQWKEFTREEALIASVLEADMEPKKVVGSSSLQLSALLLVAAVIVAIGGCSLIIGFLASFTWQKQLESPTRSHIEDLPVTCASEIEKKLPASGGYDCTFSKPLSSCELIRLEARIEGACAGTSELQAPLTGKACVLHSVQVSRHLHHGVHPIPVAFTSASVDFVVSLKDAPHIRIEIRGEDVSLFDVEAGQTLGRHPFAAAPDTWQDFILAHLAAPSNDWQTISHIRSDNTPLEFQECALLVGTLATFVGELHRGADGTLSLRPLQLDRLSEDLLSTSCDRTWASNLSEGWRTSWERSAQPTAPCEEGEQRKTHFEKVLASDDSQLLACSAPNSNSVLKLANSLLRRFPAACSVRALEFANTHCSARRVFQA